MRTVEARRGRALVTGASRGIGRAIAAALVHAGYEVMGTSRAPDSMRPADRLPGVRYLPLDLRDERSIEALAAEAGDVDVLVNNAGQSQIGAVEEVSAERMRELFETNLFGALRLTQAFLPSMRRRHGGAVINVASFAALTPVPFVSLYAASKAALLAVSRSLRQEVAPWGIRVAVIAPLDIHTAIEQEGCFDDGSPYREALLKVTTARDLSMAAAPGPDVVARRVMAVLHARSPRLLSVAGSGAAMNGFLVRHLPEGLVARIVARRYGL